MGTSSSYGGPLGKNPLLPPWASDLPSSDNAEQGSPDQDGGNGNEQTQQEQSQAVQPQRPSQINLPSVSWSSAKGVVSRIANGGSSSWNSAFRSYTRARGGSRTAAWSSTAGRTTTARLGSFLADVVRDGVVQAVRNVGLTDYIGRDAQALMAAFIDLLAPAGALLEEAIARKALIETVAELFDRYEVDAGGLDALEHIDAEGMRDIIILSVTNYINERFEQELVNCIERGNISEDSANQLSEQAKEFIAGVVTIDIDDIDVVAFDWAGPEGRTFVNNLYQMAYSLLGDEQ